MLVNLKPVYDLSNNYNINLRRFPVIAQHWWNHRVCQGTSLVFALILGNLSEYCRKLYIAKKLDSSDYISVANIIGLASNSLK